VGLQRKGQGEWAVLYLKGIPFGGRKKRATSRGGKGKITAGGGLRLLCEKQILKRGEAPS